MATSESNASMLSSDFCEDSDFFNEDESSDGFTIVTENMGTVNLGVNKGMWMLKVLNRLEISGISYSLSIFPCPFMHDA